MSLFKDAVSKDVKAVFINLNEFADKHVLDGREVVCMVDKDLTSGKQDTVANPLYGVFLNTKTIYIPAKDIETPPVKGQIIELDGEMYTVLTVNNEDGILVIVAEANEQ